MVDRFSIILLAAALLLPTVSRADEAASERAEIDRYYFALDEVRLRRDITDFRYYYARPSPLGIEPDNSRDGLLFFGAGVAGGNGIPWVPAATAFQGPGGTDVLPDRPRDIALWVDWRPDVKPGMYGVDSRRTGRALAGSDFERIGVRADVTALLFDGSGTETTAWHLTGALGSTSLSFVTDGPMGYAAPEGGLGLLWDVGVGWSSGAVSLSAGYQSASGLVDDGGDIAVLSLGADYTVLPGLSIYGELNLIDDPAVDGPERLGTVILLGTDLSF